MSEEALEGLPDAFQLISKILTFKYDNSLSQVSQSLPPLFVTGLGDRRNNVHKKICDFECWPRFSMLTDGAMAPTANYWTAELHF